MEWRETPRVLYSKRIPIRLIMDIILFIFIDQSIRHLQTYIYIYIEEKRCVTAKRILGSKCGRSEKKKKKTLFRVSNIRRLIGIFNGGYCIILAPERDGGGPRLRAHRGATTTRNSVFEIGKSTKNYAQRLQTARVT